MEFQKLNRKANLLIIKKTEEYIANLAKNANENAKKAGRDSITRDDIIKAANQL